MHKIISISTLTCAFVLLTGCEAPTTEKQAAAPAPAATSSAPEATGNVVNTELQARIEAGNAPLILDVRTPEEFADGHIAGAVNISYEDVAARIDELPTERDTEIVVHCRSGKRAATAEATLAELGFTNIRHLEGDYLGWQAAGLPLQQTQQQIQD